MPKVFVTVPGLTVRIDRYGLATETEGVEVPVAVAAELTKNSRFRVETEKPAAKAPPPRLRPRDKGGEG